MGIGWKEIMGRQDRARTVLRDRGGLRKEVAILALKGGDLPVRELALERGLLVVLKVRVLGRVYRNTAIRGDRENLQRDRERSAAQRGMTRDPRTRLTYG
jgi:hypothetical protein